MLVKLSWYSIRKIKHDEFLLDLFEEKNNNSSKDQLFYFFKLNSKNKNHTDETIEQILNFIHLLSEEYS